MQVIETLAEGLKRELKVVIPAKDMEARMNERLEDAKGKVKINGFRPGKVPFAHLKKMYGKSIMAELVNELVREKPTEILSERGELLIADAASDGYRELSRLQATVSRRMDSSS